MSVFNHDYSQILSKLYLNKLLARRKTADFTFIFNLINNRIDCSSLLEQINFYAPERRLRPKPCLYACESRVTIG